VKRLLAAALGAVALLRLFRRKRPLEEGPDPRAEELRRKLAESRSMADEREAFEGAELTVDRAEPAPEDPDARRRAVHEAARATVERMRRR
jgi:hypothetical protein